MANLAEKFYFASRFRTGGLLLLASAASLTPACLPNQNGVCHAQLPNAAPVPNVATNANRFASPQSVADRFVTAINKQNWREEYNCYSKARQSRFTYFVLLSTRELNESQDLLPELERIFKRHNVPRELLDHFPSQRLDLSNVTDPNEAQLAIQDQQERTRSQQELWAREVYPMHIDWAKLIEELQPLLIENYQRHSNDSLLVQTGIVQHLGFHRFGQVSKIALSGTRAEGSVVAIVNDPQIQGDESVIDPMAKEATTISSLVDRSLKTVGLREKRVKRKPEKIEFVKEADGWKIDSAPFR